MHGYIFTAVMLGLIGLLLLCEILIRRNKRRQLRTQIQTLIGKRKPHWCWHCQDASNHRTRHHQRALMRRVS